MTKTGFLLIYEFKYYLFPTTDEVDAFLLWTIEYGHVQEATERWYEMQESFVTQFQKYELDHRELNGARITIHDEA